MPTHSDLQQSDIEIEDEIRERLTQEGMSPETIAAEFARLQRNIRAVAARLTILEIVRFGEKRQPVDRPNLENLRKVITEKEPGSFVVLTLDEATHLCDYIEFIESRLGQK